MVRITQPIQYTDLLFCFIWVIQIQTIANNKNDSVKAPFSPKLKICVSVHPSLEWNSVYSGSYSLDCCGNLNRYGGMLWQFQHFSHSPWYVYDKTTKTVGWPALIAFHKSISITVGLWPHVNYSPVPHKNITAFFFIWKGLLLIVIKAFFF